jgi:hypothetical protein
VFALLSLKILPEILFKELVAAFRKHPVTRKIVQKAANDPENCSARAAVKCIYTLEKIDQ